VYLERAKKSRSVGAFITLHFEIFFPQVFLKKRGMLPSSPIVPFPGPVAPDAQDPNAFVAPPRAGVDSPPASFGAKRSRYICVTGFKFETFDLYNADGSVGFKHFGCDWQELIEENFASSKISFAICQLEQCPSTGRIHIQAYFEGPQRSFDAWRKLSIFGGETVWITAARGTAVDNIAYCSKDESCVGWRFRIGEPSNVGQGSRNDFKRIKTLIESDTRELAIWREDGNFGSMVRYNRVFTAYRNLLQRELGNVVARRVFVFWGPTGTGKTHAATHNFSMDIFHVPTAKGSGLYFDGYDGNEVLVIDEMHGSRMKHDFLLCLCGDQPVSLPVHGGAVPLNRRTTHVVFTSDSHPFYWYEELYRAKPLLWPMLERRIEDLVHLTERFIDNGVVIRHWPVPAPPAPEGVPNNILFHP